MLERRNIISTHIIPNLEPWSEEEQMAYWDQVYEKGQVDEERHEAEFHQYVEEHNGRLPTTNHQNIQSRIHREHAELELEYTM